MNLKQILLWLSAFDKTLITKTEYSHTLERFVLSFGLCEYFCITLGIVPLTIVTGIYYLLSVGFLIIVIKNLFVNYRKYISLIFDLLMVAIILVVAGPYHIGLFLLYCWTIIGHGYRYGADFVKYGSYGGIILIILIINLAPSWENQHNHAGEIIFVFSILSYFKYKVLKTLENEIKYRIISDRKIKQLSDQRMRDALTHLCNKTYADKWLRKKQASNTKVAVLFLDLDNFKHFNDSYGHHTGDNVLINISKRLVNSVRSKDVVCRYAGDEFIILVNDEDTDTINDISNRISTALNQSVEVDDGTRLTVTGSIGIAILGIHGNTPDEIIKKADAAMYMAKRKGRNRICWYEGKG